MTNDDNSTRPVTKRVWQFDIMLPLSQKQRGAGKPLYSADVTRHCGKKGARLEIYIRATQPIRQNWLNKNWPSQLTVSGYKEDTGTQAVSSLILLMRRGEIVGDKIKYRDETDTVGGVYFPRSLIGDELIDRFFLVVTPIWTSR